MHDLTYEVLSWLAAVYFGLGRARQGRRGVPWGRPAAPAAAGLIDYLDGEVAPQAVAVRE
jgi:hypothetical protein